MYAPASFNSLSQYITQHSLSIRIKKVIECYLWCNITSYHFLPLSEKLTDLQKSLTTLCVYNFTQYYICLVCC